MTYLIAKHSHMLFVAITFILFNIRCFMLWKHPEQKLRGVWKALPHLNDTLLLLSALWLVHLTHLTPFNAPWLAVKIGLLLGYIGTGLVAMRAAPRSGKFYLAYLAAMFCLLAMIYLARFKPAF